MELGVRPRRCSRREERGPDPGHPGAVRVGLRGDRRALAADPLHQGQHAVHVPARRAVEVAVVHVRTGLARRAHDLLRPVDRDVRVGLHQVPGVGVGRHAVPRGQRRDGEVLGGIGARRVPDEHTDPERARRQVGLEKRQDALDVRGRGRGLPARVGDVDEQLVEVTDRGRAG